MARFRSVLLVSTALMGGVPAALAAPPEEYHQCRDGSRQADVRIGQCTRVLQSGRLTDPEITETLRTRGQLHVGKRQFDLALADLTEAIKRAPDNVVTYFRRGVIYVDYLHRYDEAIEDFDRALHLNARYEPALVGRGNSYLGLKRFNEARADFDSAIAINPKYAIAFHNRGALFNRMEQFDNAIADFDAAIDLGFNSYLPYSARALAYERTARADLAAKDIRRAYEKGDRTPVTLDRLKLYGLPDWLPQGAPAEIESPLKIVLVRGFTTTKNATEMANAVSAADVSAKLGQDINETWSQARIKWALSVEERTVDDPELIKLLTTPLTETHRGMKQEELIKKRLGLRRLRDQITDGGRYTVVVLPFIGSDAGAYLNYASQKVGFVGAWSDSTRDEAPPRAVALTEARPFKQGSLAHAIAASLAGLTGASKVKCEAHCLVAGAKGQGYHLAKEQIAAARAAASPRN